MTRCHLPPSSFERTNKLRAPNAARSRLTNIVLLLIGAGLFLLSRQLVNEHHHFMIGFSGVAGWSAILYISAVFLVLTQPGDRYTLPLILAVAVACRIAPLIADPFLSSDIYRYVWDGVVQHAHISPYRYVPGDPALAFLRAPYSNIFEHINRRDYAHTIYPPVAQMILYLITWISPTILSMKVAMVLFEGATVCALIEILQCIGRRREQILLYAWCPLLIWEIAEAGHLDSVAMAFISFAILFRIRRKAILSGFFLGLAVMTKLYPIVLLPAFLIPLNFDLRLAGRWAFLNPKNWDWKLPVTACAVIAIGYAAYSSVGLRVFGFLGGYIHEEGMSSGTRYFLLEGIRHFWGLQDLPISAFYLTAAVVFTSLIGWSLKTVFSSNSPDKFIRAAFGLGTALMFLFSPHYAWYIIWLIPFFTLLPALPILIYLMAFFYLFTTSLAYGSLSKMYVLNEILYGAVFIAAIIHLLGSKTIPRLHGRHG